jgi:hypothetical protein
LILLPGQSCIVCWKFFLAENIGLARLRAMSRDPGHFPIRHGFTVPTPTPAFRPTSSRIVPRCPKAERSSRGSQPQNAKTRLSAGFKNLVDNLWTAGALACVFFLQLQIKYETHLNENFFSMQEKTETAV